MSWFDGGCAQSIKEEEHKQVHERCSCLEKSNRGNKKWLWRRKSDPNCFFASFCALLLTQTPNTWKTSHRNDNLECCFFTFLIDDTYILQENRPQIFYINVIYRYVLYDAFVFCFTFTLSQFFLFIFQEKKKMANVLLVVAFCFSEESSRKSEN